jgi:hypothetical protein
MAKLQTLTNKLIHNDIRSVNGNFLNFKFAFESR